jgi:hypothetical protein
LSGIAAAGRSNEVSFERSLSADVQGHAMEPATHHSGVPQFKGEDIKTVLLQELDQPRLVSIDHDQIRADAEQVHIDPGAADALAQVVGIMLAIIFHRRAVNDNPLFQDFGQSIVIDACRIAEH